MYLKNRTFILIAFFWLVILACTAVDVLGQSVTTLSRRCTGATPSPARAVVDVEKDGDIRIAPCTGKTVSLPNPAISGATPGGMFFAGTGGAVTQDNTNLVWDDPNDLLMVGHSVRMGSVGSRFEFSGDSTVSFGGYAHNNLGFGPLIGGYYGRGTRAVPVVPNANDNLMLLVGTGWNGTAYASRKTEIGFVANELWSGTANGTRLDFRVTPVTTTTAASYMSLSPISLGVGSGTQIGFSAAATGPTTLDTGLARLSAGVMRVTNGTTATRGLLGGGAAVASAAALPLPTGNVFHVTGTTTVTSITSTNFQAGVCITLIFDGALTFTDGGTLFLNGNFVTTADDTLSLCFDGTNWYETARSVN